uniref:Uncharacterized protein n=1 Tax=Arundo donax TaxID=35708 RepID=A0A0A9DJQ7_ARUDO
MNLQSKIHYILIPFRLMIASEALNLGFKTATKHLLYQCCFLQTWFDTLLTTQPIQACRLHRHH